MVNYHIKFQKSSKNDLRKIKQSNLIEKFEDIINRISINPYDSSDGFEQLFPPENKLYSRRLNIQHRVVYSIDEVTKTIYIYSAWEQYK